MCHIYTYLYNFLLDLTWLLGNSRWHQFASENEKMPGLWIRIWSDPDVQIVHAGSGDPTKFLTILSLKYILHTKTKILFVTVRLRKTCLDWILAIHIVVVVVSCPDPGIQQGQ